MGEQLKLLATKKNIISLLVLAVLALAIPLGIRLVRNQQILRSLASGERIAFMAPNVENRTGPNGPVQVATAPHIGVLLTPPWGNGSSPVPTVAPSIAPTPTPQATVAPTPAASPNYRRVALRRFVESVGNIDRWSSTSVQVSAIPEGYKQDQIQGYLGVSPQKEAQLSPFYDCLLQGGDHMNSSAQSEIGRFECSIIGYGSYSPRPGMHAIYRCYDNEGVGDHYTSNDEGCEGGPGTRDSENPMFYIFDTQTQ